MNPIDEHTIEQRLFTLGKKIFDVNGELPSNGRDTPQRRAWLTWRREQGLGCGYFERAEFVTVVTEFPPADLAGLESEWADRGAGLSGKPARALAK